MAVGKSSVGRLVAKSLGMGFVDIDDAIVADAGMDIPSIFRQQGEKGFRRLEREATAKVSAMEGVVIACGGGTVIDDDNLAALRAGSTMILLTADPETILKRALGDGDTRPLLHDDEKRDSILRLLEERTTRYLQAADRVVDTTGKSQSQVAQEIIHYLEGGRER